MGNEHLDLPTTPVHLHGPVCTDAFDVKGSAVLQAQEWSFVVLQGGQRSSIYRPSGMPDSKTPVHSRAFCVCLPGETMRIASSEFADDPCSSVKRGTMVRAARALLSAVTRLLILADMADVMRLLSHLKIVRM